MKYYLYKIVNKELQETKYIGITNNPVLRWYQHKSQSESNHCSVLKKAIRKYGEDTFQMIILCIGEEQYIKELEILAIQGYGTHVTYGGYNISYGGDGNSRIDWGKVDPYIFKKSNKEVSELFGIPPSTVATRRRFLKAPQISAPDRQKNIDNMTNAVHFVKSNPECIIKEVARKFDVNYTFLHNKVKKEFPEKLRSNSLHWTEDMDRLLAENKSNTDVAKELGINHKQVKARRIELGIPDYLWKYTLFNVPKGSKDRLLWTLDTYSVLFSRKSNKELGEMYGVSPYTIKRNRQRVGIL